MSVRVSMICRIYEPVELVQFCSSLRSPQSGNPSHRPSRDMISPLLHETIDTGLKSSFNGTKSAFHSLAFTILPRIIVIEKIDLDSKQYYSSLSFNKRLRWKIRRNKIC